MNQEKIINALDVIRKLTNELVTLSPVIARLDGEPAALKQATFEILDIAAELRKQWGIIHDEIPSPSVGSLWVDRNQLPVGYYND